MSDANEQFAGLRKGLLEFAILTVVSGRTVYVGDILATLAPTPFATQEGTLYPLLSKLRREEYVDYQWVESGQGPPRKYYQLTDKGAARLEELAAYWRHLTTTFENLGR
ncbi:PadR family transcriptional regulator [Terricaulis sp.]|jgi:PadR family transcriptional regulator PadR|uniref:PadR family transcriptional regulator n=1 Tax=Terricaulis sp. TaxID=2768686 RepID=UPI000B2785AA|nr:PadR family transcriptional regulator [Terricaulis sp.]MDZ4693335.1 PadR family transcriptional regulator [Terricaulis sp.]